MTSAEAVLAGLQRWLFITDPEAIEILLSVAISNYLPGDPLWLYYVGPSSGGKTEILRQIQGPRVKTVSTITPSSLISGFAQSDPEKRKVLDLMATLDGKIMIIKDLTSVLSMKPDDASKVFADLREAYDGYLEKHFGSGTGTISYHARFTLIAAVTPMIDSARKINQHLGERFIRVNVLPTEDERTEITLRALMNQGTEEIERETLGKLVGSYISSAETWVTDNISLPESLIPAMVSLADVTSLLRSEVMRDKQRVILYKPAPEVGGRLVKQFLKLGKSLANLRGHAEITEADYVTIRRVAIDCVELRRQKIVSYLANLSRSDSVPTVAIAKVLKLPSDTIREVCEDLTALDVLLCEGEPRTGFYWRLRPSFRSRYVESVGVTIYPVNSQENSGGGGTLLPHQIQNNGNEVST